MNNFELPPPIVSASWLADHAADGDVLILDASLKPAVPVGTPTDEPAPAVRIAGARVFDFDKTICDTASHLPHMMPTAEVFQREVRALGVDRNSLIVVYDRQGIYSSPRAWWMFRAMGHDRVCVLDGGLPAWMQAGFPCEPAAAVAAIPGDFVAHARPSLFCNADDVERALNDGHCRVLDARSAGRFHGREPEPRAGLRGGHIPGSINLPFTQLLDRGRMRPAAEIADLFAPVANRDMQLVFSCGSGVTACILALGAYLAGYRNLSVYDGSWSEWGIPSARPVATDSA
jgi:thiosulfate/3-mercaptopyruvate sulfurtransferase